MTNVIYTLMNDINARKNSRTLFIYWEESKIVREKYLHNNKMREKKWILGDLYNISHVVKRHGSWPQKLISILYPCSTPAGTQALLLLPSPMFSKIMSQ